MRRDLTLAELATALPEIRAAPLREGTVRLVARRPAENEREVLDVAVISLTEGVVGDAWMTAGGRPNPKAQVTLMGARAAAAIAGDVGRWPLAGDQIYVDLDLSEANMPPGTRLEIGTAVLEVSDEPHRGCGKFASRFGVDAQKFVNSAEGRALNLRGLNTFVVVAGNVRPGDRAVRLG